MKTSKLFVAALASIALAASPFINTDAAIAAPATPTLTYDEFKASQGYADLKTLGAASALVYEKMAGFEQSSTVHAKISATSNLDMSIDIKSNKVSSMATIVTSPAQGVISGTTTYFYSDGLFLTDAKSFGMHSKPNLIDSYITEQKLGQSTFISSNQPVGSLTDISPSALASYSNQDGLSSVSLSKLNMLFTEITCAPSVDAPATTECSYSASIEITGWVKILVSSALTFDEYGFLTKIVIDETSDPAGFVMNMVVTQKELTSWVPELPTTVISSASITTKALKSASEFLALGTAKQIVTTTKNTAKKKHSKLTLDSVKALAKKQKAKFTSIKNGIKIASKLNGITSNSCIIVKNGAATARLC